MSQREQARLQVLNSLLAEHMTMEQASTLMGVSIRHTRRILAAYSKEGAAALAHGHRGRRAPNAISEATKVAVLHLARTRYSGTNHTHMSELLSEHEGIDITRSTLRRLLVNAGESSPRERRPPKHRVRRQRMPREGMLIQVDGSYHRWLGKDGPQFTLLLAIDDATGIVVNAQFCELENTHSYFLLLDGLIRRCGIPIALYSDRHAVFKHTSSPETAAAPTQFSRAMDEIGIQLIFALSPQAKGRVERTAGTFQDRLVTELRLAGATTIDDANRVLEGFLPRFNGRFKVPARESEAAYRAVDEGDVPGEGPVLQVQAQSRQGQHGQIPLAHTSTAARHGQADLRRSSCGCARGTGTDGWQCSTRDATSHLRKRHRVRVSSGASPGEPRTHPSSISPPMVWVANGRPNWRLWMPTTMPSSPSPPPVATGRDEFAKLWVHGARSPRRCRRPGGRRCRGRSERGCPCVGSPGSWVYTETR